MRFHIPGSAIGIISATAIAPALPVDVPSSTGPRSMTVTLSPSSASA
jgi:hypothetical protein